MPMSGIVRFTVPGRPRPQGSKRPFVNKHTGRVQLVEQSKHVGDWRARVAHEASLARAGSPLIADEPVKVSIVCWFARPKAHYRTGRHSRLLRGAAPARPITRSTGDPDKLARAVLDALTGIVIADDSLVCELAVSCLYGDEALMEECCAVSVWPLVSGAVEEAEAA